MSYSAGNLEIRIDGISNGAEKSIGAVTRSLNNLQKSLNAFNNLPTATIGLKLRVLFNDLDTAMINLNKNTLNAFSSLSKGVRSITSLSKLGDVDFTKVASGFNQLTTAMTPFLDRIDKSQASLTSLSTVLSKATSSRLGGLTQSRTDKKLGGFLSFTGIMSKIYLARRLANVVGGILQAGSDYTETLNLWQVAMRKNLDTATEFVTKMNEAYSISRKTLMQAQATFKNMIGSLGDLSDETSYALSEAITQMAIDYASLYNVTFDNAINKFQSALAGQVRPIRAISGYDITEKTIHALYESLGGTKTMRQLSRTEKQLLAIYSVFNQMNASGALGDMNKTINNFANQSRMMKENWQEIKAWAGVTVTRLLETSGIMQHINAGLIFMSRVLEGIAKSMGAGQENFIDGIFESTTQTTKAVEELQGKLLDFDKFRSLSSKEENPLKLDETVLNALSSYNSNLDKATNSAKELADQWIKASGLFDENGVFQPEKWAGIWAGIKDFATTLGLIVGGRILYKFSLGVISIFTSVNKLSALLSTGAIFAIIKAIQAFRDGDYWTGVLATTIGVSLVGAIILLKTSKVLGGVPTLMIKTANATKLLNGTFLLTLAGVSMLVGGVAMFVTNFDRLSSKAKVWIPIIAGLAGVITALATGFTILKGNWLGAISVGALVAGAGLMVGTGLAPKFYENGAGDIKGGTLFVAGEMGKTEQVYTGSNGKTNVANVQQIQSAHINALNSWWQHAKYDIPAFKGVSSTGLYEVVGNEANRHGYGFAKK